MSAPKRYGATAMTFFGLSLRTLAITVAAVALASLAISLARPKPIESAVLGADWQCSRTAFVITTCAPRALQVVPAVATSRKDIIPAPKV